MKRVVLVVKYYYPLKRASGILRFVLSLGEKLARNVELTIVTCRFDDAHAKEEFFCGYKIVRVKKPFYMNSAIKIAEINPDVILFGTGISKAWLLLAVFHFFNFFLHLSFRSRKIKEISPMHLYQFVDMDYKNTFLLKFVKNKFDSVICTNKALYDLYSEKGALKNVHYIVPGVDIKKLTPSKNSHEIKRKKRIGFFGHLNYNKGSDILVKTFTRLNRDDMELFLAGLGPLDNDFRQKSLENKNIIINGYLKNIEAHIKSCDLLVFPYRNSASILGLSLSAIEGMAYGKPLLVSDNNCLRDLVVDGYNGYIFRDENELLKYLIELCDDNKRLIFGESSRAKSLDFDIEKVCEELLTII